MKIFFNICAIIFCSFQLLFSQGIIDPEVQEIINRVEQTQDNNWVLEKNYTVMVEAKLNVAVPLEILSDIEINAIVIDDEEVDVPFDIELNKEPDRKNYYKLKYSQTEIDIDKDGNPDTYIFSPKYLNQRIVTENYVKIKGKNISKDGEYSKKIYITMEIEE